MSITDYFASIDGLDAVPASNASALPPLFAEGYAGAVGDARLEVSAEGYAGAVGQVALSAISTLGYSIGYDHTSTPTTSDVVPLLQQGNSTLAAAAQSICAGCTTHDQRALAVLHYVAKFTYASDSSIDRWTAAVPTLLRRYGDCEDGAILVHALLLAAGVPTDRLISCSGVKDGGGHMWATYRRQNDEEWVTLEWTDTTQQTIDSLYSIRKTVDSTVDYTSVTGVLTSTSYTTTVTSDWLKIITRNSSSVDITLPALDSTGESNIAATASLSIPSATATARSGLRASLALPVATATGTTKTLLYGSAACTLPVPSVVATTGARGECSLPLPVAAATTGGAGQCVLPAVTASATGQSSAIVAGDCTFKPLSLSASALVGAIGDAAMSIPFPHVYASDIESGYAEGAARLPRLYMVGTAGTLSEGSAELELPAYHGHARAHGIPVWATSILRYDPARLAS